jgi:predicted DNA binding CopG/RHH family protein
MRDYDLDTEEQEILDAYEAGELINVPDPKKEATKAKLSAKATLNKTKNISIRLSQRDLYKLRSKAIEEGIPYQTYASSILHKAASK